MATEPTPSEHTLHDTDQIASTARVQRAQWLRAAILGTNDGILSTASLMLGVGSAKQDRWSMIISGIAGAVAGAFSMAVGEFVSVSTQRDIEEDVKKSRKEVKVKAPVEAKPVPSPGTSSMMRAMANVERKKGQEQEEEEEEKEEVLPNPVKAAAASGLAFMVGSVVPLLSSAFVSKYEVRVLVLVAVTSVALAGFGGLGSYLGGSGRGRVSAARMLIGGWLAMGITYWLLKPLDKDD